MKIPSLLCASLLAGFLLPHLFAETPAEWAEKHLREKVKGDMPGAAVLVARDGQILFQGGYGLADVDKKTPITPETKFRIGSVTKQFTAAAILNLAEQGKLAIGDPLGEIFSRGAECVEDYLAAFAHAHFRPAQLHRPAGLSRRGDEAGRARGLDRLDGKGRAGLRARDELQVLQLRLLSPRRASSPGLGAIARRNICAPPSSSRWV